MNETGVILRIVAACFAIAAVRVRLGSSLRPERTFLALGGVLGGLMLVFTPPFEVPDENVHFYRAYQISTGRMTASPTADGAGGVLPRDVVELGEGMLTASDNGQIPFDPRSKFRLDEIQTRIGRRFDQGQPTPAEFRFGLYPPVAYLPQVLGIIVGRAIGFSVLAFFYLGRLFMLAAWLGLIYAGIRLAPTGKWALTTLALTPMSVYLAPSFSADAMTNALSFLVVASFLHVAVQPRAISARHATALVLLTAATAFTKPWYFLIAWIFLLLPPRKLHGPMWRTAFAGAVIASSLAATLIWSRTIHGLDIHVGRNLALNPRAQVHFVITQPLSYTRTLLNTYFTANGDNLVVWFAGIFGWNDTPLPLWLVLFEYGLIGSALASTRFDRTIPGSQKALTAMLAVLCTLAITTSTYLLLSPVGWFRVDRLQGRYFIPIATLLVPIALRRRTVGKPERSVGPLLSWGISISGMASMALLINRFY